MQYHGERPPESAVLSELQAFQTMTDFLWQFARRAGDDLITLLGDIEPLADGRPTDPAAWDDWLECVNRIRAGLPPRSGGTAG